MSRYSVGGPCGTEVKREGQAVLGYMGTKLINHGYSFYLLFTLSLNVVMHQIITEKNLPLPGVFPEDRPFLWFPVDDHLAVRRVHASYGGGGRQAATEQSLI